MGEREKNKNPHFFKIILTSVVEDGKLRIPPTFMKKYGHLLSSSVFAHLQVPGGSVWDVELMKHNDYFWLQKGWPEFVDYYNIKIGSFLVFRLQENSHFHVLIFDASATEIEYTVDDNDTSYGDVELHNNMDCQVREPEAEMNEESRHIVDLTGKDDDDDVSIEVINENVSSVELSQDKPSKKCQKKGKEAREFSPGNVSQICIPEMKDRALSRAQALKCSNPSFMIQILKYNVSNQYRVNIPWNHARQYLVDQHENLLLTLCQPEGKTWSVKLYFHIVRRLSYSRVGWKQFAMDNNLQVGDVCVFELIDLGLSSYNAFIFRATEDVGSEEDDRSGHGPQGESISRIVRPKIRSPEGKETMTYTASVSRKLEEVLMKDSETFEKAEALKCHNPHFMVQMQPSHVSFLFSVYIPSDHAGEYLAGKHDNIVLITQELEGKTWPVECYIHPRASKLTNGWKDFALDNHLAAGDVCVFEQIRLGSNIYKVVVFRVGDASQHNGVDCQVLEPVTNEAFPIVDIISKDDESSNRLKTSGNHHCDEKERTMGSGDSRKLFIHQKNIKERKCFIEVEDEFPPATEAGSQARQETATLKQSTLDVSSREMHPKRSCLEGKVTTKVYAPARAPRLNTDHSNIKDKAFHRASALKCRNPSFMIQIQKYNVSGGYCACIPFHHARQYLAEQHKNVLLTVRQPIWKTWSVKFYSHIARRISSLRSGWKEFALDNHLRVGDVCIFELINVGSNSYRAVIFRASREYCYDNASLEIVGTRQKPCPMEKVPPSVNEHSGSEPNKGHDDPLFARMRTKKRPNIDTSMAPQQSKRSCPEGKQMKIYTASMSKGLDVTKDRRTLQRARSLKCTNPSFMLQILSTDVCFRRTPNIPVGHVREYLAEKHDNVVLTTQGPEGKRWPVKCNMYSGNIMLTKGWKDFVLDNQLAVGDICVFEQINFGSNIYKSVIFRAAVEKTGEYTILAKQRNAPLEVAALERQGCSHDVKDAVPQGDPTFNSENLNFRIVIQPSYIDKVCRVRLPICAHKYFRKANKEVVRLFHGAEGESWDVSCYIHEKGSLLVSGWSKFATDNQLRVEDVCVFELIDAVENTFKVSIYRGEAQNRIMN